MLIIIIALLVAVGQCDLPIKYKALRLASSTSWLPYEVDILLSLHFNIQKEVALTSNTTIIQIHISKLVQSSTQNEQLALIIEGNFSEGAVDLSNTVTIAYEEIIHAWESLDRHRKLVIWAIGKQSHLWVERCISRYDFQMIEMTAFEPTESSVECLHLGEGPAPSLACQTLRVENSLRSFQMEAKITVMDYWIEDQRYTNYSIISVNKKIKLFVNGSNNYTTIQGPYYMYVGVLMKDEPYVLNIEVRYLHRRIVIDQHALDIYRDNSDQLTRMLHLKNATYYGRHRNGKFDGMGYYANMSNIHVGMFRNGVRDGKGFIMNCQKYQIDTCLLMLNRNQLRRPLTQEEYENKAMTGILFKGYFKNDLRVRGFYRFRNWRYYHGEFKVQYFNGMNVAMLSGIGVELGLTTDMIFQSQVGVFSKNQLLYGIRTSIYSKTWGRFNSEEESVIGSVYDIKYGLLMGKLLNGSRLPMGLSLNRNQIDKQICMGYFVGNDRNGKGVCYKKGEQIYRGNYLNDKRHGYGILQMTNKQIKQGLFFKGEFMRGVQYLDGYTLEGTAQRGLLRTSGSIMVKDGYVYKGQQFSATVTPLQTEDSLRVKGRGTTSEDQVLKQYESGPGLTISWRHKTS